MTRVIFDQVPELPDDPEVFEEARASSEANVVAVLRTVARADHKLLPLAPAAAEFARRSVRRGIPLNTILRGYRVGHQFLVHELQETIAALADGESLDAMQRALAASFRYLDSGVDQLVHEYESEREQWTRSAAARRVETVHAILAGENVDPGAAGAVLGYPLDRTHVAAIIWRSAAFGHTQDSLERAAGALAAQLSDARPLLIPLDEHTLWMWAVPRTGPSPTLSLEHEGVRAAVGEPFEGADGFRRSHKVAQEVARVARLSGDRTPPVLDWDIVGLVALMTTDLEGARSFVKRELGRLGTADAADLRDTVRAFLAHRGSHAAAARELYVHRNTVAYRLSHAEELLGHPIADRELELRVALEVAATLGEAVLAGADR
jgi:DNA-binding PucR family transcriptional regulator